MKSKPQDRSGTLCVVLPPDLKHEWKVILTKDRTTFQAEIEKFVRAKVAQAKRKGAR
jgi:hypothetical protein